MAAILAAILDFIILFLEIYFTHTVQFESNRFINGSAIGNQCFDPPFWPLSLPPFYIFNFYIFWQYILHILFKFEPNWFVNG